MINESLEERLANRRKPGDPDYDHKQRRRDEMIVTEPHICTPNCEPGCAHAAAAETNAQLRSQLAEAREALVRVATTLGWDAPPEQGRCSSCDHLDTQHGPEGCWYTVTAGREGANLVCPCTVTAPTGRCGVCGHPIYSSGLCDAPETARRAPQSDDQAQVRVETGTETASARVDLVVGLRQRGVPQHPDGPEAAALAEIDRLRAEVKRLKARVREWEIVNADLAARCDSGDIPTRPGEWYSRAVLREIDRLRTERDRLLEELPEDNTIAAAVRRLRADRAARAAEHREESA